MFNNNKNKLKKTKIEINNEKVKKLNTACKLYKLDNNSLIKKSNQKSTINIQKLNKTIPNLPNVTQLISSIPRSLLVPSLISKSTEPSYDVLDNYRDINYNESPIQLSNRINNYTNQINLDHEFLKLNYSQNLDDSNDLELFETAMFPIDNEQPEINIAKNIIIESRKENPEEIKMFPIFDINRKTSAPLNDFYEKRLEQLCFIKIFPYGINGMNTIRDQRITCAAYGKSRIMSNDSRYQNIDYMFYLLAKIEAEKISNSINICSSRLRTSDNARINNLHIYMKNLRGYSSYWNSIKADLMAFLRNLGEPTWFITLSARDLEWPDMINALLLAKNNNNSKRAIKRLINQVSDLNFQERSKLLHDYPVVASRQFNKRFKALMKFLSKNDKILGGKIKDYWYRVEFQKRGSPHIHMLVWIENAPSFNTPEGIQFIDKVCSVSLPTDQKLKDLVTRLQLHSCTHTCYKKLSKKFKKNCRFGYPLPISETTRILNNDEIKENNNKFCIFKRNSSEQKINVYNLELLVLWNANMDIQPVGSLYGIAYYIAKYVAKEEPQNIQDELKEAIQAIKEAPPAQFARQLLLTTKIIMKNRERSAQEAAYILCGLRLKACSRTTVFVNAVLPNKRTRLVRKERILNNNYEEEDYCENLFDKYEKRSQLLEHVSLAEFASEYEFCKYERENPDTDSDSNNDEFLTLNDVFDNNNRQIFQQIGSRLTVRKRLKTAVLKTPYITLADDPNEYYYQLLVLYFPFRDESKISEGFRSIKEALLSKKHQIEQINSESHCLYLLKKQEELQKAIERIEFMDPELSIQTTLNADQLSIIQDDISEIIEENNEIDRQPISQECLKNRIRELNPEQKAILDRIRHKLGSPNSEQAFEIIHGPGGVGKSFLAKIIIDAINLTYDSDPSNLKQHVMVAAPTGVAAKAISGRTLHNAFSLPIEKFKLGQYMPIKG
jgi:hypothetical protein